MSVKHQKTHLSDHHFINDASDLFVKWNHLHAHTLTDSLSLINLVIVFYLFL